MDICAFNWDIECVFSVNISGWYFVLKPKTNERTKRNSRVMFDTARVGGCAKHSVRVVRYRTIVTCHFGIMHLPRVQPQHPVFHTFNF